MSFGVADLEKRWPDSRVIFRLSNLQFPASPGSDGDARKGIESVFAYYQSVSGITFEPVTTQENFVDIVRINDRSNAHAGYQEGVQVANCLINDIGLDAPSTVTFPETSDHGPALSLEVLPGGATDFVMSWAGESNQKLNLARVSNVAQSKRTYLQLSEGTPAVCVQNIPSFDARVEEIIWIAVKENDQLRAYTTNKISAGAAFPDLLQVHPSPTSSFPDVEISASPSLLSVGPRLLICWVDSEQWIHVGELDNFGIHAVQRLNEKSETTPALATMNNDIFLCWRGLDNKINITAALNGSTSFTAKHTSGFMTEMPLGMNTLNGKLFLFWRHSDKEEIAMGRVNSTLQDTRIPFLDIWDHGLSMSNASETGIAFGSTGKSGLVGWKGSGNNNLNVVGTFFSDESTVVHELGHTLGLMHEHKRPDRDFNVIYVGPNSGPDYHNYEISNSDTMFGPYDPRSIMHYPTRRVIARGTAQFADVNNIKLSNAATKVDGFFVNRSILITGGRGVGQTRTISAYQGATRIAEVSPNWAILPDTDSTYEVFIPNILQDKPGVPFVAPSKLLSPGDIAGLRSMYPIIDKVSLQDTSDEEPCISEAHGMLRVAWRGSGNENINVGSFHVGVKTFPSLTLAGSSIPDAKRISLGRYKKLATFREESDVAPAIGRSTLLWKDAAGEDIYFGTARGGSIADKVMIGEHTDMAPSIVGLGRFYLIAWKGDGNESINFAILDSGGNILSKFTSSEKTDRTPTLAVHPIPLFGGSPQFRVFCSWKGDDSESMNVAEVDVDRSIPSAPRIRGLIGKVTIPGETCDEDTSPAIASHDGAIVLSWKGAGNENINFMISNDDGASFFNKHVSAERTSHSPRLVSIPAPSAGVRSGLYVAWKGDGNETINIGLLNLNMA